MSSGSGACWSTPWQSVHALLPPMCSGRIGATLVPASRFAGTLWHTRHSSRCSPEWPGAVLTRLAFEWHAVQSRKPHSGCASCGIGLVPTVPAVVTWQAAQSEPAGISIPIGDSAMAELGDEDGAAVGVGV